MMRRYRYMPVLWDQCSPAPNAPAPGAIVVKVQPRGCPRNGTMGFTYVEPADGGCFALVRTASLQPLRKGTT